MHMKAIVDTIIEKTAQDLAWPRPKHLCLSCIRYARDFCTVGRELAEGGCYHDVLTGCIAREWGQYEALPSLSLVVTSCVRYRKERR